MSHTFAPFFCEGLLVLESTRASGHLVKIGLKHFSIKHPCTSGIIIPCESVFINEITLWYLSLKVSLVNSLQTSYVSHHPLKCNAEINQ